MRTQAALAEKAARGLRRALESVSLLQDNFSLPPTPHWREVLQQWLAGLQII
jgi:uncharacterized protein YlaN (UPF0358 family)